MAEWKETLEPHIKVQERIKTATQNPTTGDELIIAVALVSDAGPGTPTLIRGQKEFVETFASQEDITSEYLKSLDDLYEGAGQMWANAYRLAGSNTLFAVRAMKSDSSYFAKPLSKDNTVAQKNYILKDGELLFQFCNAADENDDLKFVINVDGDLANTHVDGWYININEVGIFGNAVTDNGPIYDFFANDLKSLVEQLNETSKFFSPSYSFWKDVETTVAWDETDNVEDIKAVKFDELYIAKNLLESSSLDPDSTHQPGCGYLVIADTDWEIATEDQNHLINLNTDQRLPNEWPEYYAINAYNSSSNLKARIRRFNHDAVVSTNPGTQEDLDGNTPSQCRVVLPSYAVDESHDFWEVAILDPSLSESVLYFNIGSMSSRGDLTIEELEESMKMINFVLPDDMKDLDLEYYGKEVVYEESGEEVEETLTEQIMVDLKIPAKSKILNVSLADLKRAMDLITEDEVYVVEGMSDLGNTELAYQNYIANLAKNENYFLPASTVNSTNYMSIGNFATKISVDSEKLYMSAPWDIDTGTLGFKFYASPSVLYWEAVSRNRKNNNEFASVLGEEAGIVPYQRPVTEFNAKTRRLLLTRKVNTVLWDNVISNWCMNDCYTKQSQNTIENEDGNARLVIHISKNIPLLLRQFIGKKVTEKLCSDVEGVINYWFKNYILPLGTTVEAWNVICKYDANLARQNKIKVIVQTRLPRTLKYIDVYHDVYDTGMEFENVE